MPESKRNGRKFSCSKAMAKSRQVQLLSFLPCVLAQLDYLVRRKRTEGLPRTLWPPHDNAIELLRVTQAAMNSRVVAGTVTLIGNRITPPGAPARVDFYHRVDGITVV